MKSSIVFLAAATLMTGCGQSDNSGMGGTERKGQMEQGGQGPGSNRTDRSTGPTDTPTRDASGKPSASGTAQQP